MSADFVDQRTNPDPASPRPPARFTEATSELADRHRFCQEGRLYDVERWIAAGRPLQPAPGVRMSRRQRFRTALEIARDRQDHALVLLLLANGYDLSFRAPSHLYAPTGTTLEANTISQRQGLGESHSPEPRS